MSVRCDAFFYSCFMKGSRNQPIGIFDSGIGGLTVAHAIHKKLPNESLIYFGDTAHFPYGDKSPELIERYALEIANYLLDRGCKMIVIACNTASAHAFRAVEKLAANRALVVNVIDPAANAIAQTFAEGRVGVIGTRGTTQSGIYPRKIKKLNPKLQVTSLATPLLAPMIEEGFFNNNISRTVIHSYLERKSLAGIKGIILACTHYPLIRKEIDDYFKGKVRVFDSAEVVAGHIKALLEEKDLLASHQHPATEFYISDLTESFQLSAQIFFREKIVLERLQLSAN
jgi:glutamate racemase